MDCKCADYDNLESWICSITGNMCYYYMPNSKACAE
jgi:hypothetical protein